MRQRRSNSQRNSSKRASSRLPSVTRSWRKAKRVYAPSSAPPISGSNCCARQTFWPKWRSRSASSRPVRGARDWVRLPCKSCLVLIIFPGYGSPLTHLTDRKQYLYAWHNACDYQIVHWIPLCMQAQIPAHIPNAILRRIYDHESHRVCNRGGGSFLPKRCSSIANGRAGGKIRQQPSISAGWPDTGASIRQCIGVNYGVGAKRAGERFAGERLGI